MMKNFKPATIAILAAMACLGAMGQAQAQVIGWSVDGGSPPPDQAPAGFGVVVQLAPPALPVYQQPPLPAPGYLWSPGYWSWSHRGYYWVPGTWVLPPSEGVLWTPGYWEATPYGFRFVDGYWGTTVGYYGGINYGFGYFGSGYEGGRWHYHEFLYNSYANNVGHRNDIHVYVSGSFHGSTTVAASSHAQWRGDANPQRGGQAQAGAPFHSQQQAQHGAQAPTQVQAQQRGQQGAQGHQGNGWSPSAAQRQEPTEQQRSHGQLAEQIPSSHAEANAGRPPVAATARPGSFSGSGVVPARPAPSMEQHAPASHEAPQREVHQPSHDGGHEGGRPSGQGEHRQER